jgi:hypothetical protein
MVRHGTAFAYELVSPRGSSGTGRAGREKPTSALGAVRLVRRLADLAGPTLVVVRDERSSLCAMPATSRASSWRAGDRHGAPSELRPPLSRAAQRYRAAVLGVPWWIGGGAGSCMRVIERQGCRAVISGRSIRDSPVGRRCCARSRLRLTGRGLPRIDLPPVPPSEARGF